MLKIKNKELKLENLWLDFGCGWNPEQNFFGLDIKNLPSVTIQADFDGIKELPDGCCEVIRSQHFIEHHDVDDVKFLLLQWNRLLNDNGKLLIFFPDMALIEPNFNKDRALDFAFGQWTDEFDIHKSWWTFKSLSRYVEKAGFKDVKPIEFKSKHHQVVGQDKYTIAGQIRNWTSGIEAKKIVSSCSVGPTLKESKVCSPGLIDLAKKNLDECEGG